MYKSSMLKEITNKYLIDTWSNSWNTTLTMNNIDPL